MCICGRSGDDMQIYRSNIAVHGHDSREIAGQRMISCKAAEPLVDLLQALACCPSS
jgi:hypothetical protein